MYRRLAHSRKDWRHCDAVIWARGERATSAYRGPGLGLFRLTILNPRLTEVKPIHRHGGPHEKPDRGLLWVDAGRVRSIPRWGRLEYLPAVRGDVPGCPCHLHHGAFDGFVSSLPPPEDAHYESCLTGSQMNPAQLAENVRVYASANHLSSPVFFAVTMMELSQRALRLAP